MLHYSIYRGLCNIVGVGYIITRQINVCYFITDSIKIVHLNFKRVPEILMPHWNCIDSIHK